MVIVMHQQSCGEKRKSFMLTYFHHTKIYKSFFRETGIRFSKVPIINGPVELLLFSCKIEVSIVLHLT